jgi:ATP-dependent RNA helicase SUPV3L1/SUV3
MSRSFAFLGPTNTGKTHRAIERMLELPSGVFGFPLRLLAREVFDRVVQKVGAAHVALLTGEEKILPQRPRYWICTVEAMPREQLAAFVGVDEIQLCAHPERGHVFTDRLLHARGAEETYFLGSLAIEPVLRSLVPTVTVETFARLSTLQPIPSLRLAKLPPRSALISFSMDDVYTLAEQARTHFGGAAIVLGALSPRTRNAQVAMFESGEVPCLVATDAIGMGLNLNINHVAFHRLRKFDGKNMRGLSLGEASQIAGRAGRHLRPGTFGGISPLSLPLELQTAIAEHRFEPIRKIYYRNSYLMNTIDLMPPGSCRCKLPKIKKPSVCSRRMLA